MSIREYLELCVSQQVSTLYPQNLRFRWGLIAFTMIWAKIGVFILIFMIILEYSCGQTKSSNLITWEPEFLLKFWFQIQIQRPWKVETVQKGVALIFPCFFGMAKFLGTFKAPKSLPNQLSLDQCCVICNPDIVDVWKNESRSNCIFFWETLTWKG